LICEAKSASYHVHRIFLHSDVNLKCVTELSFAACSETVQSGLLEQLAIACPNLQCLNLMNNYACLRNLKGVCTIGTHCHDLCGLYLKHISIVGIESHMVLRQILSVMKLMHLVMDVCAFQPLIVGDSWDTYE